MTGRKISEKNREWGKTRRQIRIAQENECFLICFSNKTDLKNLPDRRVKYFVDPENGYWNYGSMIYACQFCSALHFLGGEKSKQV